MKTPFVDLAFMKAYIKQFLTKINLNSDSGVMVSLIAYGVTTQELSPFASQLSDLNTALDTQLPPSPQRQTHLAIDEIVNKFSSGNRPGVPRIAVVFVTDLTDGNYTTLKSAALKATHEHNILFLTVSSKRMATIRDLDIITDYIPNRIISTDQYKPTASGVFELVSQVCRCMYIILFCSEYKIW